MAKNDVEVLERGNIYFVYRPKVEEESPEGLGDVQRLHVVLGPEGEGRHRLITVGKKKMPKIGERGRQHFAFVDSVAGSPEDLERGLREDTYETKTRGERTVPAARPAGEGVYAICRHGDHAHLAYVLELPEEADEVQGALNIEREASYILSIKNPEQPSPRGAGLPEGREADYPERLREKFEGRRFVAADPPDFLDHEGAEMIFVAASADVSGELGVELDAEDETEKTAEIFDDLRMAKSRHPVEPLFGGEWR